MNRLLRTLAWTVVAPMTALMFVLCLATLLLGGVARILWESFAAGLDCGRRRR